MFNRLAGVRSSSPAPSSRHLAITSQHLLSQAHAHKAVGNLEEAQKSYREAIEKAKIEHEKNPSNPQTKGTFDAMRNEFLIFLAELPSNEQPISSSVQAKSELVDYLFEKALSTLSSLELSNKPSLFLVYAHDNPTHGRAEAGTSKYFIDKLSKIQGVKLHSDQAPMGQAYSNSPEELKEDSKLEDILTNQLCLLPDQLIKEVKPVDKVVVCCSEVLGSYLKWSDYKKFHQELRDAYHEDRETYYKDAEQPRTLAIREVVRKFSQEPEYMAGFHHVLTEIAFLQIRAEHKNQHGIIPVSLTENSYAQCLADFIPATTVRMEDIPRFEQQAQAGRKVYPNQSRHGVLFKLIERVLVESDEAKTFLNKFWEVYSKFVSEPSTPGGLEFTKLVDDIFDDIRTTLHSQLARDLPQMRRLHTEIKQKLLTPDLPSIEVREALYKHYQRSNLSIQRVSGDELSLADCYINLAIVESQAQREKDKEELEKQAATFERLPSSERQRLEATNPNKLIALEKLFEKQKLRNGSERVPKRILIQGRAGIGKTTLCKKLVYEYHHNGLWQDRFESLLWVPLRQLKTHSPKRLEDLLCNQYFVGHEGRQAQALSRTFHAHQDKTLFILDGLDEVMGELDERSPLRELVKNFLTQVHVVITSRPAGIETSLLGQLDLELETVGFSPDNVQAYIEKFVPESNQAAIQQFINRTPLIQGLVNIPIQLDALCYSWDRLPKDAETITMSMLYEAMVDKLWRKDGVRLEKQDKGKPLVSNVIQTSSKSKLEKLMEDEIHYLGYLAFKGLEEGKIEFSSEELDHYQAELEDKFSGKEFSFSFTNDLKKTSFLHTADVQRPEVERHYHFLHLTFQEFFAAKFLVRHLQQTDTETSRELAFAKISDKDLSVTPGQEKLRVFITENKYNPRYEIVWWMVSGLLKSAALEYFFTILEAAPRDLIGIRHQQVMIGCLNEGRSQLNKKRVLGLEKELMQWVHFEMKWNEYGHSKLGRQRAFSEPLLLTSLAQSESKKAQIIGIFGQRSTLSLEAISALLCAMQDEDQEVRTAAARALGAQQTLPTEAISALIFAMQDDNTEVRYAAIRALGAQQTLSAEAISALISSASKDDDMVIREAAGRAFCAQKTLSTEAISALLCAMKDEDLRGRSEAADALRVQQTLCAEAVSALICASKDEDDGVRSVAARALDAQQTLSAEAISALLGAMQDEDLRARVAAARAFGAQQTLSTEAISALISASKDEDHEVRVAAARAFGAQQTLSVEAISALIGATKDKDSTVRCAAISALGEQQTLSTEVIATLVSAMKDEDNEVKSAAARALGAQQTLSAEVISALNSAMKYGDEEVMDAVAWALCEQETPSIELISALISAIKDDDGNVRSAVTSALAEQQALCAEVISALLSVMQDDNENIRSAAIYILAEQQTLCTEAIFALISAMQDDNENIRRAAIDVLAEQKALCAEAISALISAIQDDDEDVRRAAISALGAQQALCAEAISALVFAMQDEEEDDEVRQAAISALGAQQALRVEVIFELICVMQDEDEDDDVRRAAISALGAQQALCAEAISALISAMQDEDDYVRRAAARALSVQQTLSAEVISVLISALQDEDKWLRYTIVRALGAQQTLSAEAISILISALQDEDKEVRSEAARALGAQKVLSGEAISALVSAMNDKNNDVRNTVARRLDLHIDQLYNFLPNLALEQIQSLYTRFLFLRSGEHIAPLYIQEQHLHFYTAAGPGHSKRLTDAQINVVTKAFEKVQAEAKMALLNPTLATQFVD